MCQRIAQGTRWGRCGHFQRHMIEAIVDCQSVTCEQSLNHPRGCRSNVCLKVFGREIEKDIDNVDEYCFQCRLAQSKAAAAAAGNTSSSLTSTI